MVPGRAEWPGGRGVSGLGSLMPGLWHDGEGGGGDRARSHGL